MMAKGLLYLELLFAEKGDARVLPGGLAVDGKAFKGPFELGIQRSLPTKMAQLCQKD